MNLVFRSGCLFAVLALVHGCGSNNPETMEVTGTVTLDGKPVPDAIVTFLPQDGRRSATGSTDAGGSYSLATFELGDGAFPGKHGVAIYSKFAPAMRGEASPDGSKQSIASGTAIPKQYGLPATSGLTADVTRDGENVFDFEMTSAKPGK
jgi:hypothetical protein